MKQAKDKLTPREKAAGALLLCGMVLLCCSNIAACAAGLALLGAGALALNRKEVRRLDRKRVSAVFRPAGRMGQKRNHYSAV